MIQNEEEGAREWIISSNNELSKILNKKHLVKVLTQYTYNSQRSYDLLLLCIVIARKGVRENFSGSFDCNQIDDL